ncbi:MAG: hypothetical protein R3C68_01460 [Myxococcota bacterium]
MDQGSHGENPWEGKDTRDISGKGDQSIVPKQIQRWNWGAFFLSWIWGLGHEVYIALIVFVPIIGIVWPFVCGAKGSEWAWRKKQYHSVEEFLRIQRKWAWWGLAVAIAWPSLWLWVELS